MFKKGKGLILVLILGFIIMPLFFLKAQTKEVFNFYIFRRSNGGGDVFVKNLNQELLLSCGNDCAKNFKEGDHLVLSAKAREGSRFLGWSINKDNSNSEPSIISEEFEFSILSEDRISIIYAKFGLIEDAPAPVVDSADLDVPRVMFWPGKVNQHWDLEKKTWATDSDGFSGSRENKLEYCRKFYPETEKVIAYKDETTNTWKDAGNNGNYTSIKTSYRCVLKGENIVGEDASNSVEVPNEGSVCYWFPDLPLCLPLNHPNAERSPFHSTANFENMNSEVDYEAKYMEEIILDNDLRKTTLDEADFIDYSLGSELGGDSDLKTETIYKRITESISKTFQKIGAFFSRIFTRK